MPVPTPLEYGELLDGADLAQDGNGEEMELVLEILHCWPPTCRGMASRSCAEKGEEVESSFAGSTRRRSSNEQGKLAGTASAALPFSA